MWFFRFDDGCGGVETLMTGDGGVIAIGIHIVIFGVG